MDGAGKEPFKAGLMGLKTGARRAAVGLLENHFMFKSYKLCERMHFFFPGVFQLSMIGRKPRYRHQTTEELGRGRGNVARDHFDRHVWLIAAGDAGP